MEIEIDERNKEKKRKERKRKIERRYTRTKKLWVAMEHPGILWHWLSS